MASGGKKELNDYLLNVVCKQVCEYAANEVFEAINYFLAQYYDEWEPTYYQRKNYDLLHSAFKTTAKKVGNSYVAEVGIDYESLDNYKDATGWDVVNWANTKGIHGGYDASSFGANTAVWDDSIDSTITSGQLLSDCIEFLKGKGIKIIV
ncbi:MAG: hypothetical protein LBE23_05930 [Vagococcus sp.]|jgi:hypothetical protein|nr:hypothetical protein [Vagococcus sp.]